MIMLRLFGRMSTGKHDARGAIASERARQHQLNDRPADFDVDWNLFALLACLDTTRMEFDLGLKVFFCIECFCLP